MGACVTPPQQTDLRWKAQSVKFSVHLKEAAATPARKKSSFAEWPKLNTVVARKTSYAFEVRVQSVSQILDV